jgi:hypothetical protein
MVGSFILNSILFCTLALAGCGSSGKGKDQTSKKDTVKQSAVKKDTIPSPPAAPAPSLAPDEIRLKARVLAVKNQKKGALVKLQVIRFLGMGSTAPVVTSGDTISVYSSELPGQIKKDSLLVMELSHRYVLEKFKDSSASWLLISAKTSMKKHQK